MLLQKLEVPGPRSRASVCETPGSRQGLALQLGSHNPWDYIITMTSSHTFEHYRETGRIEHQKLKQVHSGALACTYKY